METTQTLIENFLIINPKLFEDNRGFFLESYNESRYNENGITDHFVQDNHTRSKLGVLRGIHFQVNDPQAQILTVLRGTIFDVAVDLRPKSKTFKKWYGLQLSDQGIRQVYMGPGIGHGFYVLSQVADLHYKVSKKYNPNDEGGLRWDDPDINIKWPSKNPTLNQRDSSFPYINQIDVINLPFGKINS